MTDQEQAERIRRLQERRGQKGQRSAAPTAQRGPGRRRRHHYHASRIVLAGLSVTSFFSILAAFGLARPHPTAPAAVAPAAAPAPAQASAPGTAPAPSAATPSKTAPATTAKPVTRSHGS